MSTEFLNFLINEQADKVARSIASQFSWDWNKIPPNTFAIKIEFPSRYPKVDADSLKEFISWDIFTKEASIIIQSPEFTLNDIELFQEEIDKIPKSVQGMLTLKIGIPKSHSSIERLKTLELLDESIRAMNPEDSEWDAIEIPILNESQSKDYLAVLKESQSVFHPITESFIKNEDFQYRCPWDAISHDYLANWIEHFLLIPKVVQFQEESPYAKSPMPKTLLAEEWQKNQMKKVRYWEIYKKLNPQDRTHVTMTIQNRFTESEIKQCTLHEIWDRLPKSCQKIMKPYLGS